MRTPVAHGSIRRRLLITLLVSAAILAVVVYFVVQSVARQVAQESQDNVLAASARSILDSVRFSGGQVTVDLPYAALSMLDSVSDERVFYSIRLEDSFLSGYENLPRAKIGFQRSSAFRSALFLGEEVRIVSLQRRVSTNDGQQYVQVSVAQTLSGQKKTLTRISQTSMGIGGGFFMVLALVAAVIARSTIQPLDRLTRSVSRRGPTDLRPVEAPVPSEMVPLVASLNSFMGRLQKSLRQSEEFIAEAAHRVRTPLAVVRTKAEIVQRQSADQGTRAALKDMIHAIDDSSRTAGQLLDHAMVTFRLDHLLREEIDLWHLIEETVERSRPIAEMKDIEIEALGSGNIILQGDPILLQNALQNLLDNAVKYTPSGSRVRVGLAQQGGRVRLSVEDNGSGFPDDDPNKLASRFARGANAQNIVGSGLGLTIVNQVVHAHGGRMQLTNNSGGGACVCLSFPSF